MFRRLPISAAKLWRQFNWNAGALLLITLSVQGLVIAAQVVAAFFVGPAELGLIRWIESAFSIALLLASCGMPAIAFREAAIDRSPGLRSVLFRRAVIAPTIAALLAVIASIVAYRSVPEVTKSAPTLYLLLISGVLLPANWSRVGVAIIQGASIARDHGLAIALSSTLGFVILVSLTALFNLKGWVVGRYLAEISIAASIIAALWRGRGRAERLHGMTWGRMVRLGATANSALLVKSLCDNLPVLLLKVLATGLVEVGLLGLAGLALFVPTFLMALLVTYLAPRMVPLINDTTRFREAGRDALRKLLYASAGGFALLVLFAGALKLVAGPSYAPAAAAVVILAATLPFRAVSLVSGITFVAYQRYSRSLVVNVVEAIVIAAAALVVSASGATKMAAVVLLASVVSAVLSQVSAAGVVRGT